MSRLSRNSNGFSLIEIVVVIAVLIGLSIAGYYIYNHNSSQPVKHSNNTSAKVSNKAKVLSTYQKEVAAAQVSNKNATVVNSGQYAGWLQYTLKFEKITFDYPGDWNLSGVEYGSNLEGCIKPGLDDITLSGPSGGSIAIREVDCTGDIETYHVTSLPITSLGQNLYLNFMGIGGDGSVPAPSEVDTVCLTKSPTYEDLYSDITPRYAFGGTAATTDTTMELCYLPKSENTGYFTTSEIETSPDFITATKIFMTMTY